MPSHVIRRFVYDPDSAHLDVEFVSGRLYRYHQVPQAVAEGMRNAFAKGEFFNAHIRDRFEFTRLELPG